MAYQNMKRINTLLPSCFGMLAMAVVSTQLHAQVAGPPEVSVMDETGVNVLSGLPSFHQTDVEIGTGTSKLTHTISSYDTGYFWGFQNNLSAGAGSFDGTVARFGKLPGSSPQRFQPNGAGGYSPSNRDGATLTQNADGSFNYTAADGTQVTPGKTIYPNGFEIVAHAGGEGEIINPNTGLMASRTMSYTTNTGLQLKYTYASTAYDSYWYFPSGAVAINNAYDYCNPLSYACTYTLSWPKSTYVWPAGNKMFALHSEGAASAEAVFTVTDAKGAKTHYVHNRINVNGPNDKGHEYASQYDINGDPLYVTRLTRVHIGSLTSEPVKKYTYMNFSQRYPRGSMGSVVWEYRLRNALSYETSIGDAKWTYDHTQADTQYRSTGKSIGPRGNTVAIMALGGDAPRSLTITVPFAGAYYHDDEPNRVKEAYENGYKFLYAYDSRGNITERRHVPSDGSADLVLTAGYDTDCNNLKTCNKPNWTKDANGNQTDYEYHAASGQVTKVTSPADANGIRPQTRYSYTQKFAWFKNASGHYARASTGIWLLTKEAYCRTSAATESGCSLAGDEVVTTYDYGPDAGPNNLFLRGVSVSDGSKTLTTCYDYDPFGNQIAETKPRAGVTSCY